MGKYDSRLGSNLGKIFNKTHGITIVKIGGLITQKHLTWIIFFSLIASFSLAVSSSFFTSNNPCSDCHRVWYEYCSLLEDDSGSYLPDMLSETHTTIRLSVEVTGSGRNRYYQIDTLSVTLSTINNLVTVFSPVKKYNNLYPGDKIVADWDIVAKEKGIDTFEFSLSAYNSHENSRFTDYYSYQVTVNAENDSDFLEPAIRPHIWSVTVGETPSFLTIYSNRTVNDLQLDAPEGFVIQPSYVQKLHTGDEILISISANSEKRLEKSLDITWKENGTEDSLTVLLIFNPPIEEPVDFYKIAGRILGISCFFILILSMILGGFTKKLKLYFKVNIGNAQRVKIHCYMSWLLLILSIFHGFILVIKPYNDFFWDIELILGDISAIFMLIVSINGSFMKLIIRLAGYPIWLWMHRIFSWAAVLLILIHAILIGTDFAIIREVLNL